MKHQSIILFLLISAFLFSCTTSKQISKAVKNDLLNDSSLSQAHTGIAVFDPQSGNYLLKYNSNRLFVPASNVKIATLYAGMKYLGEQLPGIMVDEQKDTVYLLPTGDPTFLHPGFLQQPVFDFLKMQQKPLLISSSNWNTTALGNGWSWDDYLDAYSQERSPLPVYNNLIKWTLEKLVTEREEGTDTSLFLYSDPEIPWDIKFSIGQSESFRVVRPQDANFYTIIEGKEMKKELSVPFVTDGIKTSLSFIKDTLQKEILLNDGPFSTAHNWRTVYSQPVDSLFKPMMHTSDNFFAEQTLLMVSQMLFGEMNEQRLIDSLLKSLYKELPQRPRWVDGSGLSRYNLFSPEDFVWLLNKLNNEFGTERMKNLFPTGGQGSLRNYFLDEKGLVFAKTGTLSGQFSLSGYVITKKNRLLIFSVMINNHNTSSTAVRKAVERFVKLVRENY